MTVSKLICAVAALLAVLLTPAWAGDVTVTGTVTYRERIALPADARLQVTLVALPWATRIAGAASDIPARGGVPVNFSLNLRTNSVDAGGAHGLLAEISSQSRVMFRNVQPVPVDLAAPMPVEIVVNFSPDPPHPPPPAISVPAFDFLEQDWTVTSIGGRPVIGTRPLTLSIEADYGAGGSGGCNNYFAETNIEQGTIVFGPAAATRMACDPAIMEQEAAYFAALAAVASYEHDKQSLRLLDAAGIPLIGLIHATE